MNNNGLYLGLNLVGVLFVDNLLSCGRDEDIARLVQQVFASVGLGTGEANNGAVLDFVVFQFLLIIISKVIKYKKNKGV